MENKNKRIEPHLVDKRNEIIFSLVDQGYTKAQVARMFNITSAGVAHILQGMPRDWESPWVKRKK